MTGEDAYLIVDINHTILHCNQKALIYLSEMHGKTLKVEDFKIVEALLVFLLAGIRNNNIIKTTTINGLVFQVYPFPMSYVHGIVEMYHWITIHKEKDIPMTREENILIPLTKREKRVAELLCQGLSYQAIADELVVSFHTVKNHVQNIFSKYGVNTRYQFFQIYGNKLF